MPTPMESNTLGLQEILRTVNTLPAAESGGGGSFEIPLIDLVELGFPNYTGSVYNETVMIDSNTYNTLKTKLEFGFVKIRTLCYGTPLTIGFSTGVWPDSSMPLYNAATYDYAGMKYTFAISLSGGTYEATLTIGG